MNAEHGANGVATFLGLTRPINFSPFHIAAAVPNMALGPVTANRNLQRAAFSTAFISTGLALSALYTGIFNGGRHARHTNNTLTPVKWLEYPVDYVSPVFDLFAEDQVPLDVSSPLSCPKDSEHLERAFDLLRYRYLCKTLGVPSVVNLDSALVLRLFRILGNASSGSSAHFLSATKLPSARASSTQGGLQQTSSGSSGAKGGEKFRYESSSSKSNPKITMNSTRRARGRLLPESGDEEFKAHSKRTGISVASITIAIAVLAIGLLAKHSQSGPSPVCSSEPPTTVDNFVQIKEHNFYSAPFSRNQEPTSRLVLGVLIQPQQSLEQLFEDDPLVDSYTSFVVLQFDKDSHTQSDVGCLQDDSAPDVFAARFDALQDALPSFQELQNLAEEFLLELISFVLFSMAIFVCFALHVMVFFVTGHFGRRGIRQLMKALRNNTKHSDATPAVKHEAQDRPRIKTPRQEIEPVPSELSTISYTVDARTMEAYEKVVACWAALSLTSAIAAARVDKTVETLLAPVVEEGKPEVAEDQSRGRNGKAIADQTNRDNMEPSVQSVSSPSPSLEARDALPFTKRIRGRRGHCRGRGQPPAVVAEA